MHKANFIWSPVSEEPTNIEAPVLVWTENNKLMTFKYTKTCLNGDTKHSFSGWNNLVSKYNIKYWVYQNDVMNI